MIDKTRWQWWLDKQWMKMYHGGHYDIRLRWQSFVVLLILAVISGELIADFAIQEAANNSWCFPDCEKSVATDIWRRIAVLLLGIWVFGTIATVLWSDAVGRLFSPLLPVERWVRQDKSPRLVPALTGLFERSLFAGLTIFFLRPHGEEPIALLGVIGAYIALRAVRIDLGEAGGRGVSRVTSIHAIWNIGFSITIAVAAGWAFWHVPFK